MKEYRFRIAQQIATEFPRVPGHRGYPRTRHIKRILRHGSRGSLGAPRGYDPRRRLEGDRRRRARVRIEAVPRQQLGIGRYDPWPDLPNLAFLVNREPEEAIDAVLCRACLNIFADDTVVGVEDADQYDEDQWEVCDHCGRRIGGGDD